MKTIYTDKLGLMHWAMLAVSVFWFWRAFEAFENRYDIGLAVYLALGIFFGLVGVKRFIDVHAAKKASRDPTVVRVTHD